MQRRNVACGCIRPLHTGECGTPETHEAHTNATVAFDGPRYKQLYLGQQADVYDTLPLSHVCTLQEYSFLQAKALLHQESQRHRHAMLKNCFDPENPTWSLLRFRD
jgi:hypothetical protein